MKFNLLFFLLSVVLVVKSTNHTDSNTTTTTEPVLHTDPDVHTISPSGEDEHGIDHAVETIENATSVLKGSYNGTDSSD